MNETSISFNNPAISVKTYHILFDKLRQLSNMTYTDLVDTEYESDIRFHEVRLTGPKRQNYQAKFRSLVDEVDRRAGKRPDEPRRLPPFYQFSIYTDRETVSPRVIGFAGKLATFNVVWLDYEHAFYPRQSSTAPN